MDSHQLVVSGTPTAVWTGNWYGCNRMISQNCYSNVLVLPTTTGEDDISMELVSLKEYAKHGVYIDILHDGYELLNGGEPYENVCLRTIINYFDTHKNIWAHIDVGCFKDHRQAVLAAVKSASHIVKSGYDTKNVPDLHKPKY